MSKGDEVARRITARLRALEQATRPVEWEHSGHLRRIGPRLYRPRALRQGNRIFITYVSYQRPWSLTFEQAEAYLRYLDTGGTARHYEALRQEGA